MGEDGIQVSCQKRKARTERDGDQRFDLGTEVKRLHHQGQSKSIVYHPLERDQRKTKAKRGEW